MQRREGVSARTLALSTAAAELGRVILRAGQSGSVRAALLGNRFLERRPPAPSGICR